MFGMRTDLVFIAYSAFIYHMNPSTQLLLPVGEMGVTIIVLGSENSPHWVYDTI